MEKDHLSIKKVVRYVRLCPAAKCTDKLSELFALF